MMSDGDRNPGSVGAVAVPAGPFGVATSAVRLGPAIAGRCRRRVHLDFDPDLDPATRRPPEPGLLQRWADLDEHRDRVHAELRGSGLGAVELPEPVDVGRTGAVTASRPAAIWSPLLRAGHRIGRPDLLVRDGDGYRPVLVRGHRTLDPGRGAVCAPVSDLLGATTRSDRKVRRHFADLLALAHLHRLLEDLGLAASGPARGAVIGRGGPSADPDWDDAALAVWHELPAGLIAEYDARIADRHRVAIAAATRQPALAQPSRVAECRRCPWWPRCSVELVATHDVSLLAAGSDVAALHEVGITTVDDLAAVPEAVAAELVLGSVPAVEARVRARAWLRGLPLVRRTARVAVPRADVELDVDMESYLDDGAYLWGTYLTGADVGAPTGYRAFATWELLPDRDEGRAFAEFWQYLRSLQRAARDRRLTMAVYCYSRAAEERWLRSTPRRHPDVPGMPSVHEIAEFCASPAWVDLYAEIRSLSVVPGSMRLKALAPVAGFEWRDPEPRGENSMAWYRQAVGADTGIPDLRSADRVLRYNEDDVLATLALRRWITEHAHEVPTVGELEAGPAVPEHANPQVTG